MGALVSCLFGGPGLLIHDRRFRVLSRIATGGFSVVDLIEDSNTNVRYALKRVTCMDQGEERKAFQEIEYYKMFRHPNIIPVIDSDMLPSATQTGANDVLSVFPLFAKGTLLERVESLAKHGEHLRIEDALKIFRGICEGVLQMHTLKPVALAHRDLKLGNVLLDNDDTPILMDFGSMNTAIVHVKTRKDSHELQEWATVNCTLSYRAPELCEVPIDTLITDRTDIWSLGCMLFAMIYGVTPFEHVAGPTGSLALAIAQGRVNFPIIPTCPAPVQSLITSMLNLEPSARPSIQQVLSSLDRIEA